MNKPCKECETQAGIAKRALDEAGDYEERYFKIKYGIKYSGFWMCIILVCAIGALFTLFIAASDDGLIKESALDEACQYQFGRDFEHYNYQYGFDDAIYCSFNNTLRKQFNGPFVLVED